MSESVAPEAILQLCKLIQSQSATVLSRADSFRCETRPRVGEKICFTKIIYFVGEIGSESDRMALVK